VRGSTETFSLSLIVAFSFRFDAARVDLAGTDVDELAAVASEVGGGGSFFVRGVLVGVGVFGTALASSVVDFVGTEVSPCSEPSTSWRLNREGLKFRHCKKFKRLTYITYGGNLDTFSFALDLRLHS
jgi:hypothetical protein